MNTDFVEEILGVERLVENYIRLTLLVRGGTMCPHFFSEGYFFIKKGV